MALALYRTYRPGSLSEVIGQEHVTDPLGRALSAGRTHHAYLFSGPRGCGKTSTARILARSLNCEQGPTAEPCEVCRSCIELAPNGPGSIDVVELDAATHRGIDDARDLREKAIYAPAASRYKVYIIDEAHQLTNEAANALLKLVEEPPPHLRFIFATTEPDKIIPTIRSRTFHYGFRLVPARILTEHLASVCASEGVPAEGPALAVVARAGAGSVRDSLSVLGQLLAGAGQAGLTYAEAVSALGLTDDTLIDRFVAAMAAGSAADMFGVVDGVISAGHDPRRFVSDVLDRLRDLIILRADPTALESGLVDVPDDAGQRMLAQAQSLGLGELSRAADLVSDGLTHVKGATAPRLQLELLCARLALPHVADDHASLVARLERLERVSSPVTGADPDVPASPVPAEPRTVDSGSGDQGSGGPDRPGTTAQPPARPQAPASGAARPAPPKRPDLRSASGAGVGSPSVPAASSAPAAPEPGVGDSGAPAPARHPGPAAPPATAAPAPVAGAGVPARTADPRTPAAPRVAAPETSASGPSLGAVQSAWPAILDRLASSSRVAWTAFHAASPVSVSAGALAVAVSEPGSARAIAQRGHDERLRQAIIDVLGADLTIDILHDPEASTSSGRRAEVGAAASTAGAGPGGPGSPDEARTASAAGTATPTGGAAGAPVSQSAGSPTRAGPAPAGPVTGGAPDAAGGARADAAAGAAGVRAASASAQAEVVDEPSADDPDLDGSAVSGLALITRELGARPIGEIDHS